MWILLAAARGAKLGGACMAAEVKLDDIIEGLELADDLTSFYVDVETGEVCSLTEDDLLLADREETAREDRPAWQREALELARRVRQGEGTRYLALPSKFDVHEWAIMDRFSQTLDDADVRNDLRGGIRGAGAFRMFKRLLSEYDLWDAWNRFKQDELRQLAVEWCKAHGLTYR